MIKRRENPLRACPGFCRNDEYPADTLLDFVIRYSGVLPSGPEFSLLTRERAVFVRRRFFRMGISALREARLSVLVRERGGADRRAR